MTSEKSSRRDVFQTIVASALLSAAPLSALEAATAGGRPAVIELTDGSRLRVRKVGDKRFLAVREQGSKVVDKNPTGSFTSKNGEQIVLDQGKVMNVAAIPGQATRGGSDWFGAFWK